MQPIQCDISYKSKKTKKNEEMTILLAIAPNVGDIIVVEDKEIIEDKYKTTLEVTEITHYSSEDPKVVYSCKDNTHVNRKTFNIHG